MARIGEVVGEDDYLLKTGEWSSPPGKDAQLCDENCLVQYRNYRP